MSRIDGDAAVWRLDKGFLFSLLVGASEWYVYEMIDCAQLPPEALRDGAELPRPTSIACPGNRPCSQLLRHVPVSMRCCITRIMIDDHQGSLFHYF